MPIYRRTFYIVFYRGEKVLHPWWLREWPVELTPAEAICIAQEQSCHKLEGMEWRHEDWAVICKYRQSREMEEPSYVYTLTYDLDAYKGEWIARNGVAAQ